MAACAAAVAGLVAGLGPASVSVGGTYTYNTTVTSNAWLNTANWTGGTAGTWPGVDGSASTATDGTATDVAVIGTFAFTPGNGLGINFNTANGTFQLGAIDFNTTTGNVQIGNSSSARAGVLTLNGGTVNGQANTILTARGTRNLTIAPANSGTTNLMTVQLGTTANVVQTAAGGASFGPGVSITSAVGEVSANSSITLLGGGDATNRGGSLTLSGTNTFTGGITVGQADGTAAGRVVVTTAAAALPTSGTFTVNPNSQFRLEVSGGAAYGAAGQALNLGSLGVAAGSVANISNGGLRFDPSATGSATFNPAIGLTADAGIHVETAANTLSVPGVVSGGFGVTKTGAGTLVYAGTAANTYTGTTTVSAGTLALAKSAGTAAVAGPLTIGDATVVRLDVGQQVADTSAVTINGTGLFRLNGNSETIGGLSGAAAGGVVENNASSASTLTVASSAANTFAGVLRNGGTGTLALVKSGAGTLALSGASTYTGTTAIQGGTLAVNGSLSAGGGAVDVGTGAANTGTLAGTGGTVSRTVNLNAGGAISPGDPTAAGVSTAALTVGTLNVNAGSTYRFEVNNATGTAGGASGWDQVRFTALNVLATPDAKATIRVIGTPAGMANGTTYTWTIATGTTVSGFVADAFVLDTSAFDTGYPTTDVQLSQSGGDINLSVTPTPEPGAAGLLGLATAGLLGRRRGRRNRR